MVRILLFAAALVAALEGTSAASQKPETQPPPAAASKTGDPSGVYLCEGTNPDGHRYRGIVQIAAVRNSHAQPLRTKHPAADVLTVAFVHAEEVRPSRYARRP